MSVSTHQHNQTQSHGTQIDAGAFTFLQDRARPEDEGLIAYANFASIYLQKRITYNSRPKNY
jgi:hypothetical protein